MVGHWEQGRTSTKPTRGRLRLVVSQLVDQLRMQPSPGKIYRYEIDLWHTGVTIAVGHRLRVEVSSASFPAFERNLNTGGNNETEARFVTAEQTLYHDARHASYVLLPRIPD